MVMKESWIKVGQRFPLSSLARHSSLTDVCLCMFGVLQACAHFYSVPDLCQAIKKKEENPSRICSLPSGAVSYCCHCQSRCVTITTDTLLRSSWTSTQRPPWSGGVLWYLAPGVSDVSGSCFWKWSLHGSDLSGHPTDAPLDWDLEYQTSWLCSSKVPEPLLLVSGHFVLQKEEIRENVMVPWTSSDSSSAQPEYPRSPQYPRWWKYHCIYFPP